MNAERLGIFGGTFAPLHYGHLEIAKAAKDELDLDRVLFVVAGLPYQKQKPPFFSKEDRLAMVRAGVETIEGFEASDLEVKRKGPSYMVDTLKEIRREINGENIQSEVELFLILGADAANQLNTWKSPGEIKELAELVVVKRPGHSEVKLPEGWEALVLEGPNLDISGSEIIELLKSGLPLLSLKDMVPDAVLEAIKETFYEKTSEQMALIAGNAAADKKANDTKILDVGDLLGICDFFVITSGDNPRQVKAISEAVEEDLKLKSGVKPIFIEGLPDGWLLMDYGDIVIHIFSADARKYYNLERLWSDCPVIPLE